MWQLFGTSDLIVMSVRGTHAIVYESEGTHATVYEIFNRYDTDSIWVFETIDGSDIANRIFMMKSMLSPLSGLRYA